MAGDNPRLVVDLEARVTAFEKQLAKATKTANDNYGKIDKRTKQFASKFESDIGAAVNRAAGHFRGFAGGVLGGVGGLSGIVATMSKITTGIAEVGDAAKRSGISSRAFQELAYVAKTNRIQVDALTDGMKELSLRADEFIKTGQGSGAESFQRLGYDAATLATKLKDPSALFTEIIGKLGQLDRAAQIRIADELFGGTGGEKFVQLIAQGEEGIRATVAQAHALGAVLDDEVIERAGEIDKKFGLISTTISGWVQPQVISFLNDAISLADRFNSLQNQQDSSLDEQLADVGRRRLEVENQIKRYQNGEVPDDGIFGTSLGASTSLEAIEDLKRQNEALAETERRIMDVIKARQAAAAAPKVDSVSTMPPGGYTVPRSGSGGFGLNGVVSNFVNDVVGAESGGKANAKNPNSSATGLGQFIESTWLKLFREHFPDRAQSMSDQTILALRSDAEISRSLIEAYAKENADLLRQAGVSVNEAALQLAHFLGPQGAIAVLTAKAGTPIQGLLSQGAINANPTILGHGATVDDVIRYAQNRVSGNAAMVSGQKDAWEGLRDVTSDVTANTAQLTGQYSTLEQVGVTAIDALSNALADGKITGQEMLGIVGQIAKQLLTMPSVGGGGSGTGFLGSLLGLIPGFAGGTHSAPGGMALVGERGPELVNLPRGSQVLPTPQTIATLRGPVMPRLQAPANQNRPQVVELHVTGNPGPEFIPTIQAHSRDVAVRVTQAGIGQYDKQLNRSFGGKMANAQARQL